MDTEERTFIGATVIVTLMVLAVGFALGLAFAASISQAPTLKQEAVELGYGTYQISDRGQIEFRWYEPE